MKLLELMREFFKDNHKNECELLKDLMDNRRLS